MVAPQGERGADLIHINGAVVDACRASLVAALMIYRGFDDVRQHAQIGKSRAKCSSQIMQRPRLHTIAKLIVERSLCKRPQRKAAGRPFAKKAVTVDHTRY